MELLTNRCVFFVTRLFLAGIIGKVPRARGQLGAFSMLSSRVLSPNNLNGQSYSGNRWSSTKLSPIFDGAMV